MNRKRAGTIVFALGLLLLGIWIIGVSLNLPIIKFRYLWPIIPMWFGFSLLVQFASDQEKRGGLIFAATFLILSFGFVGLFTIGILAFNGQTVTTLWPIILLIIGASFLALYLGTGMNDQTLLMLTSVSGGPGLFFLPITLGTIRTSAFAQVLRFWPLLVLMLLLVVLFGPRTSNPDQQTGS